MTLDLRTPLLLVPTRPLHRLVGSGALFAGPKDALTLTFDDGPDPVRTPAVLDLLARFGARATFFLLGERAARHPALVRRIAQEGHGVGNHSWSHRFLPGLSEGARVVQWDRAHRVLAGLSGRPVQWVRPPYGWADGRFYDRVRERGWRCALWTVDAFDYLGLGAQWVHRLTARAGRGDVVLFHDGNPAARGTLGAVEWLLERARAQKLRVDRLPEGGSGE
jgi:peptidoglycan/xylan/chitin deacetylase (PgdA/CDA1 family)